MRTSPLGVTKPALNDYFNAWHTPANLNYYMLADAIGGVTALTDTDTYDGYTIAQVVKALRNLGVLA